MSHIILLCCQKECHEDISRAFPWISTNNIFSIKKIKIKIGIQISLGKGLNLLFKKKKFNVLPNGPIMLPNVHNHSI